MIPAAPRLSQQSQQAIMSWCMTCNLRPTKFIAMAFDLRFRGFCFGRLGDGHCAGERQIWPTTNSRKLPVHSKKKTGTGKGKKSVRSGDLTLATGYIMIATKLARKNSSKNVSRKVEQPDEIMTGSIINYLHRPSRVRVTVFACPCRGQPPVPD